MRSYEHQNKDTKVNAKSLWPIVFLCPCVNLLIRNFPYVFFPNRQSSYNHHTQKNSTIFCGFMHFYVGILENNTLTIHFLLDRLANEPPQSHGAPCAHQHGPWQPPQLHHGCCEIAKRDNLRHRPASLELPRCWPKSYHWHPLFVAWDSVTIGKFEGNLSVRDLET